jgi:hypothetical protein
MDCYCDEELQYGRCSLVKSRLFAIALALISTPVLAGTGTGLIGAGWNIYGDGNVFFYLAGPHESPACSAIPDRWASDTTTPGGRSMFATFVSAYMAGKSVTVYGSTTCIHGNTEAVVTIYVND